MSGSWLSFGDAASEWCRYATEAGAEAGAKPWSYLLIPHDAVVESMLSLDGLAATYTCRKAGAQVVRKA